MIVICVFWPLLSQCFTVHVFLSGGATSTACPRWCRKAVRSWRRGIGWWFSEISIALVSYCGWKKSCTTLDGWNPMNNGINNRFQLVQDFFHPQYGWFPMSWGCPQIIQFIFGCSVVNQPAIGVSRYAHFWKPPYVRINGWSHGSFLVAIRPSFVGIWYDDCTTNMNVRYEQTYGYMIYNIYIYNIWYT